MGVACTEPSGKHSAGALVWTPICCYITQVPHWDDVCLDTEGEVYIVVLIQGVLIRANQVCKLQTVQAKEKLGSRLAFFTAAEASNT
jgi:hypothetical protein